MVGSWAGCPGARTDGCRDGESNRYSKGRTAPGDANREQLVQMLDVQLPSMTSQ